MVLPRQNILSLGSAVTVATTCAFRFSSFAACINASTSFESSTTAIRSCDSEIASSVPSKPSYFFGTLSKLMRKPSANSPIATQTPPAPKSLQRLINFETEPLRNKRCILRSVGGLPFCTSAPQTSMESVVWALEEPVAPPQPSRPVAPPNNTITSPSSGVPRITFSFGEAPMTAPISIRFAI